MNNEIQSQTFRHLLQEILIKRCRNNKSYSLRAFSRSLGVSPSALTEMLSGKRKITKKSIEKLGLNLGLSMEEINSHVEESLKTSEESIGKASYRQITIDQYSLISDWYHYAIIELIKVKNFEPESSWIAQALNITVSEANIAIERLLRLGLLEMNESGFLVDTSSGFSSNISSDLTSSASRQLQKQILEQAIEALETVPLKQRNQTSMTMAIDPALIPEAIKKIALFRRELCEYLESQGSAKEVYQMSVSLFPITKLSQKEHV
jgi:uncharacterized protein (TIGR02147 family)